MAHSYRSVYLLSTVFLMINRNISTELEQCCEFANIHVTNEDGSEQVFTVKQLKPFTAGYCAGGHCHPGDRPLNLGQGGRSNPVSTSATGSGRSLDLSPTITILIGETHSGCGSVKDRSIADKCWELQQLVSRCPSDENLFSSHKGIIEKYALFLADNGLLPMPSDDAISDRKIAYGLVLLSAGLIDETTHYFTMIIQNSPNLAAAFYGRGLAYTRRGNLVQFADKALNDFNKAIELDGTKAELFERKAEILIPLGRYDEALRCINQVLKIKSSTRAFFLRATVKFAIEDLKGAEDDFRRSLHSEDQHTPHALYNLGLTLYYRGKLRNSIEVFKDALRLRADHVESHLSIAHVYSELGDYQKAFHYFNQSLSHQPGHVLTLQLRGYMHYNRGQTQQALNDFKKCLTVEPDNETCRYMQALSDTAMGSYYQGIKSATKVMVGKQKVLKVSSEFMKAHYLREYSRYLHHNLDDPVSALDLDEHLSAEFRDNWARILPFRFKEPYREQPGITPEKSDVTAMEFDQLEPEARELLCAADKLGSLMAVSVDGHLENLREKLATGLAVLHISQTAQKMWVDSILHKKGPSLSWRKLVHIAVQYTQLVNPDLPILWFDKLPDEALMDGYSKDIYFIRGHTINSQLMQYFDLVFKLVKTMIEHYQGDDSDSKLREDVQHAETYEDLITLAKKKQFKEQGYVLSTQVPSVQAKTKVQHDGAIITLSSDQKGKMLFNINLPISKSRTASYYSEMEYLFQQLQQEIGRAGGAELTQGDTVVNLVLSMLYYFYNLAPLSRDSSVVAYTVALGLLMSVGREVTGRIPNGKLAEMEAILSGAPDAFVMAAKNWMNIKKMDRDKLSSLPRVAEVLPTVRSTLEALNMVPLSC